MTPPAQLIGCLQRVDDVDAAAVAVELDEAVDQGVEREIVPLADAAAGEEAVADLAHQNVAGPHLLAAETLDAAALTVGVATVAAGTLTLLMCHGGLKSCWDTEPENTAWKAMPHGYATGKRVFYQ